MNTYLANNGTGFGLEGGELALELDGGQRQEGEVGVELQGGGGQGQQQP